MRSLTGVKCVLFAYAVSNRIDVRFVFNVCTQTRTNPHTYKRREIHSHAIQNQMDLYILFVCFTVCNASVVITVVVIVQRRTKSHFFLFLSFCVLIKRSNRKNKNGLFVRHIHQEKSNQFRGENRMKSILKSEIRESLKSVEGKFLSQIRLNWSLALISKWNFV